MMRSKFLKVNLKIDKMKLKKKKKIVFRNSQDAPKVMPPTYLQRNSHRCWE